MIPLLRACGCGSADLRSCALSACQAQKLLSCVRVGVSSAIPSIPTSLPPTAVISDHLNYWCEDNRLPVRFRNTMRETSSSASKWRATHATPVAVSVAPIFLAYAISSYDASRSASLFSLLKLKLSMRACRQFQKDLRNHCNKSQSDVFPRFTHVN